MRSGFSIKRSTTPLSPHPLSRGIIPATATTKMLRLARTSTLDAAALTATTDCKGTRPLPRVSIITKGNLGQPPCRFCLTPSNKRSHFGPSVSRSIGRQCAESWHGGTRCGNGWSWPPRRPCQTYEGTRLRLTGSRRTFLVLICFGLVLASCQPNERNGYGHQHSSHLRNGGCLPGGDRGRTRSLRPGAAAYRYGEACPDSHPW